MRSSELKDQMGQLFYNSFFCIYFTVLTSSVTFLGNGWQKCVLQKCILLHEIRVKYLWAVLYI